MTSFAYTEDKVSRLTRRSPEINRYIWVSMPVRLEVEPVYLMPRCCARVDRSLKSQVSDSAERLKLCNHIVRRALDELSHAREREFFHFGNGLQPWAEVVNLRARVLQPIHSWAEDSIKSSASTLHRRRSCYVPEEYPIQTMG